MVRSKNRLLTTVAYRLNGKTTYALEGAIFVAGASVQWLRDKLHVFEDAAETDTLVKTSDPASAVYLVPAFVGLGAPKQEYWMRRFRGLLQAPLLVGVGAAFDFHSGAKPQAPKFIRSAGLEWVFRLVTEPKRLWPRYRKVIPAFLAGVAMQGLGLRTYTLD